VRLNSAWKELPDASDGSLIFSNTDSVAEGAASKPIVSLSGRYVYVAKVIKKNQGSQPALAEVRADLTEKWTQEERRKKRRDFYETLLEAAKTGTPNGLAHVAKAHGLSRVETDFFARSEQNQVPQVGASPELTAAAFSPNAKGLLPQLFNVGGKFYLAALEARKDADLSQFEKEKAELTKALASEEGALRQKLWVESARKSASVSMAQGRN